MKACYDIFLNEIMECIITNEELAQFKKKLNSNDRQNTLRIC